MKKNRFGKTRGIPPALDLTMTGYPMQKSRPARLTIWKILTWLPLQLLRILRWFLGVDSVPRTGHRPFGIE